MLYELSYLACYFQLDSRELGGSKYVEWNIYANGTNGDDEDDNSTKNNNNNKKTPPQRMAEKWTFIASAFWWARSFCENAALDRY